MASGNDTRRLYEDAQFNVVDSVLVFGSFELDGTGNSPVNVRGEGFTVAHSGAGDYLITFAGKYPMCVSFVPSLEDADGGSAVEDSTVYNEAYDSDTGTIVVKVSTENAGALTKSDALNGPRVNFVACFHKYSALSKTHA